jgi:ribosomal protein S9
MVNQTSYPENEGTTILRNVMYTPNERTRIFSNCKIPAEMQAGGVTSQRAVRFNTGEGTVATDAAVSWYTQE